MPQTFVCNILCNSYQSVSVTHVKGRGCLRVSASFTDIAYVMDRGYRGLWARFRNVYMTELKVSVWCL